jgi:hypothetical protein
MGQNLPRQEESHKKEQVKLLNERCIHGWMGWLHDDGSGIVRSYQASASNDDTDRTLDE